DAVPKIAITVVDAKTNQPVAGVRLTNKVGALSNEATTDEAGRATLSLRKNSRDYAFIFARKSGYAPMRMFWKEGKTTGLPTSFRLEIPQGKAIGGRVQDEDGRPIADATVHLWYTNLSS